MDKPVSCERYTQKVGSGNDSQTAREDDLHDQKKQILLQTEKVLPEIGSPSLTYLKQDCARPSAYFKEGPTTR